MFCDYFAAPSDDAAVGVLDLEDGPATSYDTVDLRGIEGLYQVGASLDGAVVTYGDLGRGSGGDDFRVSFGLVKEIVTPGSVS